MLKILKDDKIFNLNEIIDDCKSLLEKDKEITLDCNNHIKHIAAYSAWMQMGGNIYVIPPHYNDDAKESIKIKLLKLKYTDSIFFCTSGTTNGGVSKICIHKKQQMHQSLKASTSFIEWGMNDIVLNFIPACSIGFWQIIISAFIEHEFTLILGNKTSFFDDLKKESNCVIMVPALIDLIEKNQPNFDFSKFNKIISGSTMVSKKQTNFFFKNGGKRFINIYGSTETGCLLLADSYYNMNDNQNMWKMIPHSTDVELKIVNDTLHVKGKTLCENICDFESFDGEWYNTNDVWKESNAHITFLGRNDDFVKTNAHLINLLDIDLIAEEGNVNSGEVMSTIKYKLNSEYIELFYTNKNINLRKLKDIYKNKLSKYSIPSKYTYIESIPKNHIGKKMRKEVT
jgi:acyl-coenzyme A synthetase/AMP-(fatty) acid ligase